MPTSKSDAYYVACALARVEREARWAQNSLTDADWATHPLAIEYRRLMRAWWALPSVDWYALAESPTRNRLLSAKGGPPMSPGERFFACEVGPHQKQLRLRMAAREE